VTLISGHNKLATESLKDGVTLDRQPKTEKRHSVLSERLFDTYAANLSACLSERCDYIECPLCLGRFSRDDIRSGAITDEHIIARGLGSRLRYKTWGKLRTLTCRRCNNRDGTRLDAHLIRGVRAEDILAGLTEEHLDVRFIVGGTNIGADLYLSAGGKPTLKVIGDKKRSDPKMQEASGRAFEQGEETFKIEMNLGYSPLNLKVAFQRIAYLLMFRHFGYHYIRHESVRDVREQISRPDKDLIVSNAVHRLDDAPPDLFGLDILHTPHDLRCFFVTLDLSTALDRYVGVVMPGLDSRDERVYERWGKYAAKGQKAKCSSLKFPINPQATFNPKLAENIRETWHSAITVKK
jgi:hypothetical protein